MEETENKAGAIDHKILKAVPETNESKDSESRGVANVKRIE